MNIRNKLNRFFTLSRKSSNGFTLVELIVVIAILAILGGVALPAYSGYVKKAEIAADQQLVDAVNTAFASACLTNGVDHNAISYALIDVAEDGSIKPADGSDDYIKGLGDYNVDATQINARFVDFYKENEDEKFSVYTDLECIAGIFYGSEGGVKKTVTIDGKNYEVSEFAINNFKKATAFSENVDELQNRVDGLTGSYRDVVAGYTVDALGEKFGEDYEEFIKDIPEEERGNATVLYVAQQAAGKTANDAYDQLYGAYTTLESLNGRDWSQTIRFDDFSTALGTSNDTLGTTAMLYGAITAYANGADQEDSRIVELKSKLNAVHDSGSLMSAFSYAIGSTEFMNYCSQKDEDGNLIVGASDQFVTDMNGYLGALEGINSASGAFEGDLANGNLWTGEDAESLLEQLLGQ